MEEGFEVQFFSAKETVKQIIAKFKPQERAALFEKILRNRQKRIEAVVGHIKKKQQDIQEQYKPKRSSKWLASSFSYSSTELVNQATRQTLSKCFHFYFSPGAISREEEHTCSICVKELEAEEKVTELSCSHLFHLECIEKWFKNKLSCPNCRKAPQQEEDIVQKQLTQLVDSRRKIQKRNKLMLQKMEMFLQESSRSQ